jgi:hypothetical protein
VNLFSEPIECTIVGILPRMKGRSYTLLLPNNQTAVLTTRFPVDEEPQLGETVTLRLMRGSRFIPKESV